MGIKNGICYFLAISMLVISLVMLKYSFGFLVVLATLIALVNGYYYFISYSVSLPIYIFTLLVNTVCFCFLLYTAIADYSEVSMYYGLAAMLYVVAVISYEFYSSYTADCSMLEDANQHESKDIIYAYAERQIGLFIFLILIVMSLLFILIVNFFYDYFEPFITISFAMIPVVVCMSIFLFLEIYNIYQQKIFLVEGDSVFFRFNACKGFVKTKIEDLAFVKKTDDAYILGVTCKNKVVKVSVSRLLVSFQQQAELERQFQKIITDYPAKQMEVSKSNSYLDNMYYVGAFLLILYSFVLMKTSYYLAESKLIILLVSLMVSMFFLFPLMLRVVPRTAVLLNGFLAILYFPVGLFFIMGMNASKNKFLFKDFYIIESEYIADVDIKINYNRSEINRFLILCTIVSISFIIGFFCFQVWHFLDYFSMISLSMVKVLSYTLMILFVAVSILGFYFYHNAYNQKKSIFFALNKDFIYCYPERFSEMYQIEREKITKINYDARYITIFLNTNQRAQCEKILIKGLSKNDQQHLIEYLKIQYSKLTLGN